MVLMGESPRDRSVADMDVQVANEFEQQEEGGNGQKSNLSKGPSVWTKVKKETKPGGLKAGEVCDKFERWTMKDQYGIMRIWVICLW